MVRRSHASGSFIKHARRRRPRQRHARRGRPTRARPRVPNILFILADDLGYGDLSCYGRPDYETPVLDGLARQGLKFLERATRPRRCARRHACAFATGRYPQRARGRARASR